MNDPKPSVIKPPALRTRRVHTGTRKRTTKRREQQRAIDTRAAILEAALSEFAQKGFEGASTRIIGKRAGVQHPLVRYHYRTKEILWRATAEHAFEQIRKAWDERIPETSDMNPVERVREEFNAFFRFTMAHPDFHQFMLWESRPGSPRLSWLAKNMLGPTMSRILPQIRDAQLAGDLPPSDPGLLYYMLIGMTTVLSSLAGEIRVTCGVSPTNPTVIDSYAELLDAVMFRKKTSIR